MAREGVTEHIAGQPPLRCKGARAAQRASITSTNVRSWRDSEVSECAPHFRLLRYYVDDTIIVFRRVQNTGLADILFLRRMEHRNKLPVTTALNENALRLFKRVRKREVEKAMRDGCNVPERVLEEFVDLKDGN